jgi:Holliday junction resolvase RusA-like endonuclease
MSYKLELEINTIPPLLNRSIRTNRYARYKNDKAWIDIIFFKTRNKIPSKPLERYSLKLIRCSPREPDYDNLVASFKPVVDALRKADILKDDRYSNSGQWDVHWIKTPKKEQKIIIQVYDH